MAAACCTTEYLDLIRQSDEKIASVVTTISILCYILWKGVHVGQMLKS